MNCFRCGHTRNAHDHYRGGLDCAVCECRWFLAPTWWRTLLERRRYTKTETAAGAKRG